MRYNLHAIIPNSKVIEIYSSRGYVTLPFTVKPSHILPQADHLMHHGHLYASLKTLSTIKCYDKAAGSGCLLSLTTDTPHERMFYMTEPELGHSY